MTTFAFIPQAYRPRDPSGLSDFERAAVFATAKRQLIAMIAERDAAREPLVRPEKGEQAA